MRVAPHRWSALVSLVGVLMLVSCSTAPTGGAAGPDGTAAGGPMLAPDNAVFELDDMGLKHLWSQELGQLGSTHSVRALTVTGQYLVVEAEGSEIHCFDATWGDQKSVRFLHQDLEVPPTASGTTVQFMVGQNLYQYDVPTDELGEPHRPGLSISTAVLVLDGTVVMAASDGHLAKMPAGGGDRHLLTSLDGPIEAKLVEAGGVVFAVGNGDRVVAWDVAGDRALWYWAPPAPGRLSSGIAVSGSEFYIGDDVGFIYAVGAQLPEQKWKKLADAPIVGQPVVSGGKLLALTNAPEVICLDLEAGHEQIWSLEGVERVVAASDEVAYLLKTGNVLVAIELDTGEQLWADELPADCIVAGDPTRPAFYIANSAGSIVGLAEYD